ncbi:FixH family protein [Tianweitania sp. BSSL-BM11]|uniref:FixH family protein n=1 Tax=Tianweitania aestuarii TaxID=2814886 RepID=A0ABS5RX07_9HYPH|nr:FixH family protein [Tianweitania aestuarii]MBS9721569.1 FixH family protein [Tianweitania aestuarii]
MSIIPRDGHPFTGWHMLGVVFLFFGTIISVNIAMAYWAVSTFPGLNAHNSYVASQNYNLLLKDAAAQEKRGWQGRLTVDDGRPMLTLRDREGSAIHGLDVAVLAGRPSNASTDRELTLAPVPNGYRADQALERGRWLVEIEARRNNELLWRQTKSITVE